MKYFVTLLCAALLAISAAKDLHMKGLKSAKIKDYPSLASISNGTDFIAHGIILSNRVIMIPTLDYDYEDLDDLDIRVGSSYWFKGGELVAISDVVEAKYITLVILEEELTFGPSVKAASFAKEEIPKEFSKVQIVGWGYPSATDKVEHNGFPTTVLTAENMPVMSQDECEEYYPEFFDEDFFNFPLFCATSILQVQPETDEDSEYIGAVFRNGEIEAFVVDRHADGPVLLVHSQLIYKYIVKLIRSFEGIVQPSN